MTALLIYIGKVALLLVAFYLFYKLLLSRETFHRLGRYGVASQSQYQVHARFVLLDTETGYQSQYLQQSFLICLD